jgi:hypothetical protein
MYRVRWRSEAESCDPGLTISFQKHKEVDKSINSYSLFWNHLFRECYFTFIYKTNSMHKLQIHLKVWSFTTPTCFGTSVTSSGSKNSLPIPKTTYHCLPRFQASAAMLRRYALFWDVTQHWAVVRRFGTTYRSHLQGSTGPSRKVTRTSWLLKMGPISCPETSVKDYHSTLRTISEERRSQHTLSSLQVLLRHEKIYFFTLYVPCTCIYRMICIDNQVVESNI